MTGSEVAAAEIVGAPARPSWRTTLLVAASYVALSVWWLWPLPVRMTDHAICPPAATKFIAADLSLITWALTWDTHALLTRPLHLFDANVFHPAPLSLAFSEHFLGYVPLFAPTWLLTGNPVLATNAVILLAFPLCALAAYALARRFVAPPAAFLAGLLFAFHGERYVNVYHVHQLGTFWVPLALLATERWLERARTRDALLLMVAVALQLLSSFYLAYALVLFYATYLPIALLRWRHRLDRRRYIGLCAALLVAGVPAALASLPYLELQRLGLVPSGRSAMVEFLLTPMVTMGRVHTYLTSRGVGPLGYALAAIAVVVGWGRAGWYARVIGVVAVLAGLVLASGPSVTIFGREWWSPYGLLFRHLPGFSAVRLPFRFLVLTQLGFALLAALGLAEICRRVASRAAWPVALLAAAGVLLTNGDRVPHPLIQQTTSETLPPAYRWLATEAHDGALLDLPLIDVAAAAHRMVLSTWHWRPVIDGYSAYPPLTRRYLLNHAVKLPDVSALQELVDHVDLRWILVHLQALSAERREPWLRPELPGLRLVARWGDDLLFEVTLAVANDRRDLLVRTDRTLGGLPLQPVGDSCQGRIEVVAPEALTTDVRRPIELRLRIVNDGPAPLPGFGLYPRHLVRLRRTLLRNGVVSGLPASVPLWTDVPSGQAVEAVVETPAVPLPGPWTFQLDLEQDGESLARCGMRGTTVTVQAMAGTRPAATPASTNVPDPATAAP